MLDTVDITLFLSLATCSFVDSWKVLTCQCSTVGCHSECDTSEPEQPAARTRHQSPTATHTHTHTHTHTQTPRCLTNQSLRYTARPPRSLGRAATLRDSGNASLLSAQSACSVCVCVCVCVCLPDKLPSYVSVKQTELL